MYRKVCTVRALCRLKVNSFFVDWLLLQTLLDQLKFPELRSSRAHLDDDALPLLEPNVYSLCTLANGPPQLMVLV